MRLIVNRICVIRKLKVVNLLLIERPLLAMTNRVCHCERGTSEAIHCKSATDVRDSSFRQDIRDFI